MIRRSLPLAAALVVLLGQVSAARDRLRKTGLAEDEAVCRAKLSECVARVLACEKTKKDTETAKPKKESFDSATCEEALDECDKERGSKCKK